MGAAVPGSVAHTSTSPPRLDGRVTGSPVGEVRSWVQNLHRQEELRSRERMSAAATEGSWLSFRGGERPVEDTGTDAAAAEKIAQLERDLQRSQAPSPRRRQAESRPSSLGAEKFMGPRTPEFSAGASDALVFLRREKARLQAELHALRAAEDDRVDPYHMNDRFLCPYHCGSVSPSYFCARASEKKSPPHSPFSIYVRAGGGLCCPRIEPWDVFAAVQGHGESVEVFQNY